ncbi:hypothetical protein GBA52_023306 [Prunus armeniaca]|nr:hypothetical protein GBA52_023306 [Prunus armeniaca]
MGFLEGYKWSLQMPQNWLQFFFQCNNLSGTIPKEVLNLKDLQEFDVSWKPIVWENSSSQS